MKDELVHLRAVLVVIILLLGTAGRAGAVDHDWLRYGRDAQLTNDAPPTLAPRLTRGSVERLGRLWTARLDGPVIASPLYVHGLDLEGRAADVVHAVTEGGSCRCSMS